MIYKEQTVATLRKVAKERSIGTGVWRAGAKRNELVSAILADESGKFGKVLRSNEAREKPLPPLPKPDLPTPDARSTDLGAVLAQAIQPHVQAKLDEKQVIDLIKQHSQKGLDVDALTELCIDVIKQHTAPREILVARSDRPAVKLDRQHFMFEMLLLLAQCRIPVFMAGPAGSGKTTAAQSVAKALGLECEAISFGPMTTKADMFGYKDANGAFHDTPLVRSALKGKVFLGDEVDAANAGVLTGINMVLANGHIALPDGMLEKHDDFVPLFAGNTLGTGANRQYVGRNQLDAATLDRFAFLEWGYDEGLEASYAGVSAKSPEFDIQRGTPIDEETWVMRVQILRRQAEKSQQRMVISPRATIYGCQLIQQSAKMGKPIGNEVLEELLIWKAADPPTRDKITNA